MSDSTRDNPQASRSLGSRLRFSHKLTILSIVFVVPTLVAIYFLMQFLQEQVSFSAKERQGAEAILPLGTLMLTVQSHGGVIGAIINGSKAKPEEVSDIKRRSDADIAAVDTWMASTGKAWGLNDKWVKFKDGWAEIQTRGSKDEAAKNFDDHATLAGQAVELISLASDISNITLDPEMEEYALGDTIVNQLPATASSFARARSIALAGLAAAGFSTEDRTRLANSQALGADAFSRLQADVDKSIATQPAVRQAVEAPVVTSQKANAAYSQAIDQTLGFAGAAPPEVRQARSADFHSAAESAVGALGKLHQASTKELDRLLAVRVARFEKQRAIVVGICLATLMVAVGLAIVITRTLTRDIGKVTDTVGQVAKGEYGARVRLGTRDEIGNLARAFDNLLDERVATLEKGSKENEQLNTSVIDIMRSVAQLAQRDLTVRVPVSADVTGAISDAINMMTNETTKALKQVSLISISVADATGRVKLRSDEALQVAQSSGVEVNAASSELANAATALREIAVQAQSASKSAENAIAASVEAMTTVRATVDGISLSRDQIRETEKRVKRLGERSQEISSVIGIIGQIAERTSVLALNASMQAVAAGDAGRGFAVVADEVKRLAENARQATQQIASLVSAIQADTVETTQAMNNTIAQVVDISKLAERAGGQMQQARTTTEDLVNSVRGIVTTTEAQAKNSDILLNRARQLVDANAKTLLQLGEQRKETDSLQGFSKGLIDTVQVFRLPG